MQTNFSNYFDVYKLRSYQLYKLDMEGNNLRKHVLTVTIPFETKCITL